MDSEIIKIKEILLSRNRENNEDIFFNYDLRGEKVYKLTEIGRRWLVPKMCRWQIVKANHDKVGHFSYDKTIKRSKKAYWFPKMNRFVKKYVGACLLVCLLPLS